MACACFVRFACKADNANLRRDGSPGAVSLTCNNLGVRDHRYQRSAMTSVQIISELGFRSLSVSMLPREKPRSWTCVSSLRRLPQSTLTY